MTKINEWVLLITKEIPDMYQTMRPMMKNVDVDVYACMGTWGVLSTGVCGRVELINQVPVNS